MEVQSWNWSNVNLFQSCVQVVRVPQCPWTWCINISKLPLNQSIHSLNESWVPITICTGVNSLVSSLVYKLSSWVNNLLQFFEIDAKCMLVSAAEWSRLDANVKCIEVSGKISSNWRRFEQYLQHVVHQAELCNRVRVGGIWRDAKVVWELHGW